MGQPDDLTARARIRDAALLEFAEHGTGGATIRGIAAAAGVSPGLVQHHFGSKEKLRRACDAYAFDTVRQIKRDAWDRGEVTDPGVMTVLLRTALPVQRYVARAIIDGSQGAAALFDELVEFTKEYLESDVPGIRQPHTTDLHAYATVLMATSLGTFVLREHISRALGADPLSYEGYPRFGLAMLDIHSESLLSPEMTEKLRATLEHLSDPTLQTRSH